MPIIHYQLPHDKYFGLPITYYLSVTQTPYACCFFLIGAGRGWYDNWDKKWKPGQPGNLDHGSGQAFRSWQRSYGSASNFAKK